MIGFTFTSQFWANYGRVSMRRIETWGWAADEEDMAFESVTAEC